MSESRSANFLARPSRSSPDKGFAPDFLDYLAIKNVLTLYCVALDTKDFDLLRDVFTPDVEAVYPFATMQGLNELSYRLSRRLVPTTTQHALTTQHINFPPPIALVRKKRQGPTTAHVMTYFTATHFGKGQWTGRALTTYGKFIDELVKVNDDDDYDGEGGGQWRISRRETRFMATIGDERIVTNPG